MERALSTSRRRQTADGRQKTSEPRQRYYSTQSYQCDCGGSYLIAASSDNDWNYFLYSFFSGVLSPNLVPPPPGHHSLGTWSQFGFGGESEDTRLQALHGCAPFVTLGTDMDTDTDTGTAHEHASA
ncbi:uncharacterized protein DMAD_08337 [Drosophila madeirensis]|uniref:Uncharacterized protein n=1 Tax=Drosophila madeirensis TaxID=30013 RepID=A0AAU9ETT4_DROMD